MGGKGSAPPPPDYVGATQLQGEISKENLTTQNFANRPTINTPWGTQSWQTTPVKDPATGQIVTGWTQNTTLAPGLQQAVEDQFSLQAGRSDLANSFMGRVANEYGQPFDYSNLPAMAQANQPGNLQTGTFDYVPGLTTNVDARTNNMVSGFGFNNPQMSVDPMINSLRNNVATTPLSTQFDPMTGDLSRSAQTENLQRGLQTGDNPALPMFDSSYRDTVARSLMERMTPVHERQQNQLETQLANQGFTVGSEGYRRALDELNQRQAAERYNALDTAGNEAQRLFQMGMGARQQAFNEDVTGGQFFNQAANQAFQQGMSANQFRNQATQQAFNQAMGANQAFNQAQGQRFQQDLAAGQFGNQASQQAFNQMLGAGQFGNQAQQQLYGQMMGQADLANRVANQGFQQDLAARQFQNQALGQAQALDLARMQVGNQAIQQQQGLNQQFADAQNRLRQQAIAEQMQRRGMSLNEMNALLSGQQVQMPNMPSFNTAGRAETPNLLGALGQQYDAQLGAYNAEQAAGSNMLGGLFSLGASALMPGAGSLFGFGR